MSSGNKKAEALLEKEKGNEAYKQRDFPAAHQHYDKAIELDPTDITFLTNKAAVYFEESKYEECIKTCETAVEIGREHRASYQSIAKAYARIANAYFKQDKLKESLQFYDKSLSEHRDQAVVKKRVEIEKKVKEQERVAYINPDLAKEEKEKGNEQFRKGDYGSAVRHYTEAIKRNPEDPILFSNRAASYTKLMEFRLAVSDCDECIKLDPKFVKGYLRKGAALMALHENDRALRAYESALETDPNNQEAMEGFRNASLNMPNNPEERARKSMEDPEVREILADPAMRLILEQMQQDPKALREHLQNPDIAQKIGKLMEAGIIGLGPKS